ncbi:MAG: RNA polymerase sigma factor [Lachnospiraceae bacterium]
MNRKSEKLEELYCQHGKTVYGYLMKMTGNPSLAEELTQETFYQAFLSLDRYRGDCGATTWLCQIAKHLWFHYVRKERRLSYVEELLWQTTGSSDAEETLLLGEERAALQKAIESLPDEMKTVVLLRIYGELSFSEIAEATGRTENWARVTFYRAKQRLALQLNVQ